MQHRGSSRDAIAHSYLCSPPLLSLALYEGAYIKTLTVPRRLDLWISDQLGDCIEPFDLFCLTIHHECF